MNEGNCLAWGVRPVFVSSTVCLVMFCVNTDPSIRGVTLIGSRTYSNIAHKKKITDIDQKFHELFFVSKEKDISDQSFGGKDK